MFVSVRGSRPGKNVQLTENEIRGLCLKSREIFLSQPIMLELEAPLKICGEGSFSFILLTGLYAGSNYCQSHVLVDRWMLTVKLVYKLSNCVWWPETDYKHTFDIIYTHFQGITNNIYGFKTFLLLNLLPVHPYFYPVHIRFYSSKWWFDGSLHKATNIGHPE